MANTSTIPFASAQWSIDYQDASLEPDIRRRQRKLDLAVDNCLCALRQFGDEQGSPERAALRIALHDLLVLRSVSHKYE